MYCVCVCMRACVRVCVRATGTVSSLSSVRLSVHCSHHPGKDGFGVSARCCSASGLLHQAVVSEGGGWRGSGEGRGEGERWDVRRGVGEGWRFEDGWCCVCMVGFFLCTVQYNIMSIYIL